MSTKMSLAPGTREVNPLAMSLGWTATGLSEKVQAGWARLRPAGDWKTGYFGDILQEHFGIQPNAGGITIEVCPACGGALHVHWASCVFYCSQCEWHGGLRQVEELTEQRAKEERHQGEQRRAKELLRVIAAGGITIRREAKNHDRGAAVAEGLTTMAAAETPTPLDGWLFAGPEERARKSIQGNLEGFRRCGQRVVYREFEHKMHGNSYQPVGMRPCNEPGHEECGWWEAIRDLGKWTWHFRLYYPVGEVLKVVQFGSPGLGYTAARHAVDKLKKRKALQTLLGRTVGFLHATEQGYAYFAIVRAEGLDLLGEATSLWEEVVGENATVSVHEVEPDATALDLAAELRCRVGQALPLLVYHGTVSAWQALQWRGEELQSRANHTVFGPGFRVGPAEEDGKAGPDIEDAKLPGTFSAKGSSPLGENVFCLESTDDSSCSQEGAVGGGACNSHSQEDIWQPCEVCGDPACGQRPTGRFVPWRQVVDLIEKGKARERPDGIVTSMDVSGPSN